jgi:hypothetical protein
MAQRDRCGERGQAAVELVAVLPVVLALLGGLWQAALLGDAAWAVAAAARAAARAAAVGGEPGAAARAHLPARLERGLRVREADAAAGVEVKVTVVVPSVLGAAVRPGRVSASASFAGQR